RRAGRSGGLGEPCAPACFNWDLLTVRQHRCIASKAVLSFQARLVDVVTKQAEAEQPLGQHPEKDDGPTDNASQEIVEECSHNNSSRASAICSSYNWTSCRTSPAFSDCES